MGARSTAREPRVPSSRASAGLFVSVACHSAAITASSFAARSGSGASRTSGVEASWPSRPSFSRSFPSSAVSRELDPPPSQSPRPDSESARSTTRICCFSASLTLRCSVCHCGVQRQLAPPLPQERRAQAIRRAMHRSSLHADCGGVSSGDWRRPIFLCGSRRSSHRRRFVAALGATPHFQSRPNSPHFKRPVSRYFAPLPRRRPPPPDARPPRTSAPIAPLEPLYREMLNQ